MGIHKHPIRERKILCTDTGSVLEPIHFSSIGPSPGNQQGLVDISSFELLGTIQSLDLGGKGLLGGTLTKDQRVEVKLYQAMQAVGRVLGCCPLTAEQGVAWFGRETMELLLSGAKVFALVEQVWVDPSACESLWQHSLRTASLAGMIAKDEQADRDTVLNACTAGVLHDIGLLVLATLESDRYEKVMLRAQKQDRSLASLEEEVFSASHHSIGATWLQQMGVSSPIVEAVEYHDEPFLSLAPGFTPVTAVYAANVLDGGGWPQDGDGVPSEWAMEYLDARRLAGCWPKWREYSMRLQEREI